MPCFAGGVRWRSFLSRLLAARAPPCPLLFLCALPTPLRPSVFASFASPAHAHKTQELLSLFLLLFALWETFTRFLRLSSSFSFSLSAPQLVFCFSLILADSFWFTCDAYSHVLEALCFCVFAVVFVF